MVKDKDFGIRIKRFKKKLTRISMMKIIISLTADR